MLVAPVDDGLEDALAAKLAAEYPDRRMRFSGSANAQFLDSFTGMGIYSTDIADPSSPGTPVADALRRVWASPWRFRSYEELAYRGIDPREVGIALLVHRSYLHDPPSGVALTANPYDASGMEPGFDVKVQVDGGSVVNPAPGETFEEYLHYWDMPGRPIEHLSYSSLVAEGDSVLDAGQRDELGRTLDAIRELFRPVYGADPSEWYAMAVEFKFDSGTPGCPLLVNQAIPQPGW
jgi:hypothetical protein